MTHSIPHAASDGKSGNLSALPATTCLFHPHPANHPQVTSDPRSETNPVEEGTGIITSDSLAAESLRSGGDFAANESRKPGITDQTSKGFTGNTTDTSGARRIDGDSTGEDPDTTQASLDADQKLGKDAGVGPTYSASAASKGTNSDSSAGVAPTIYQDNVDERVYQPKGEGLEEGGSITGQEKNTSYAPIGSKNDPSLLAEQKFQRENADQAAAAGYERGGTTDKGGFEQLDREERA